jgi:hypothetical protein
LDRTREIAVKGEPRGFSLPKAAGSHRIGGTSPGRVDDVLAGIFL